jgi:cytochrome c-type biogenesis protein CcmH
MPIKHWLFLFGLLALLCTPQAQAAGAQDVAADPALEARVNALSAELRCLVCQNQTIADSHADLAVDLKNQVREQLKAGRSEKEVIDYMTAALRRLRALPPAVQGHHRLAVGRPGAAGAGGRRPVLAQPARRRPLPA